MPDEINEPNITVREQEVIDKILVGLSNKAIADALYISERTVKFHCSNIYKKFDTCNRAAFIVKVHEKIIQHE